MASILGWWRVFEEMSGLRVLVGGRRASWRRLLLEFVFRLVTYCSQRKGESDLGMQDGHDGLGSAAPKRRLIRHVVAAIAP